MSESQKYPEVEHPRWDRSYQRLARLLSIAYPVEVAGEIPSGRAEVIIPNHTSSSEVVVQGIGALEFTGVPPVFIAKKELMRIPGFGRFLYIHGGVVVDRAKADHDTLNAEAYHAAQEGRSTINYGEGSRHKGLKEPTEVYRDGIKIGGVKIAEEIGVQARTAGTVLRGHRQNLVYYDEAFDPRGVDTDELYERMQNSLNLAVAASVELWGEAEGYEL